MKKVKTFFKDLLVKIKNRYKQISVVLYIKTNILFITYVLINLINSWLLRIVTMGNLFSFKAIISDLAFILVLGSFAYLLKPYALTCLRASSTTSGRAGTRVMRAPVAL